MFNKQLDLIHKIEDEKGEMRKPVCETVTAITAELGEILECDQTWKHWRENHPEIDHDHLIEEVVDLWHFVIQLTIYLGFGPGHVWKVFKEKHDINIERQEGDY